MSEYTDRAMTTVVNTLLSIAVLLLVVSLVLGGVSSCTAESSPTTVAGPGARDTVVVTVRDTVYLVDVGSGGAGVCALCGAPPTALLVPSYQACLDAAADRGESPCAYAEYFR